MQITFNEDTKTVTATEGYRSIELSYEEVAEINRCMKIHTDYHDDVILGITNKISANELPNNSANNDAFIHDLTEKYADLRDEHDTGDPGNMLDWTECLDMAFEDVNYYQNYAKSIMITDIQWCADDTDIDEHKLPTEVEMPKEYSTDYDLMQDTITLTDTITDWLSDTFYFCVSGFGITVDGERWL